MELSKQEQNKKARAVQAMSEPGPPKSGTPRYVNGVPHFGNPEALRRQELEAKQQRRKKQERPHILRYHVSRGRGHCIAEHLAALFYQVGEPLVCGVGACAVEKR